MRDLGLLVREMERQGKRLHGLFRVGRLNTITRAEFGDLVGTVGRLQYNLTDFNVVHFGPEIPLEHPKRQTRRHRLER